MSQDVFTSRLYLIINKTLMNILDKKVQEVALKSAANIDCLVSRFYVENDAKAHDVDIVHEATHYGYKIYVRLKSNSP